jgi:hypothetical protein
MCSTPHERERGITKKKKKNVYWLLLSTVTFLQKAWLICNAKRECSLNAIIHSIME